MASDEPSAIPMLHFLTDGLPDAEAFAHWRQIMAPMFETRKAHHTRALPRGNLTMFIVGEIIVNRCTFNAQRFSRDAALIAATPGHIVMQYYRSGGFRGTVAGRPVCVSRGQVAVADLTREADAYAASSDTIGLSVPRALLEGIDLDVLTKQLDPPRHAVLGRFMATLPRRVSRLHQDDVPSLTAEIVGVLKRIFAAAPLGDGTIAKTANADPLARALAFIDARQCEPDLAPADIAAAANISRATLYRLFAPMGGVRRYVQERRLLAMQDVLCDILDKQSLAQLAAEHGFKSQAPFSRAFRARFGMTPRQWRRQQIELSGAKGETSSERAHALWRDLGRDGGTP